LTSFQGRGGYIHELGPFLDLLLFAVAGVYRPRHPERTVLYPVLFHYFDQFRHEYESHYEKDYGLYADAHRGKVKKASLKTFPLRIVEGISGVSPPRAGPR
jgi:hypothetical protein